MLYLWETAPHASRPRVRRPSVSGWRCKLYGSIRACAGGGRVVGACVGLPVAGWVGSLGCVGRSGAVGGRWACRWVGGRLVVGVGGDAGV